MRDGTAGGNPAVRTLLGHERSKVVVTGELDAMSAPDVHAAIGAVASREVELDLGAVTFIDSSGLASVIEGHLRLAEQGRRLVVGDRSPIVQRLLDLSGVSRQLPIDD